MEWIQERMGVLELEGAFRDISWGFAVKARKKLWLLGDVGSWDFFFFFYLLRREVFLHVCIFL